MSERGRTTEHVGLGGKRLGANSPLFGGDGNDEKLSADDDMGGDDGQRVGGDGPGQGGVGVLSSTTSVQEEETTPRPLPSNAGVGNDLVGQGSREVDDWGRSERMLRIMQPLLDFYYHQWFRVETEGIENVPSEGGALLVSNHSGALPPDGPMIMEAVRNEHPSPRPVYMLGEHWFKGYPGIGMLANKIGLVPAHPANAQRLLHDQGKLALVFPEGQKGTRKVLWQKYRLRRFGRGGFVRTAIRARVPIVPISLIGGEEAMPIWAHMRRVQKLTGLIYAPINHASPWLGAAAGLAYLPAKFKIRFGEPIRTDEMSVAQIDDAAAVQEVSEEVRGRIKESLDEMLASRKSVWLG